MHKPPPGVTLRDANGNDADAVARLIEYVFPDEQGQSNEKSAALWRMRLERMDKPMYANEDYERVVVAERDGAVIGMLVTKEHGRAGNRQLNLRFLSVEPEYRRKGIGLALVQEATKFAQDSKVPRFYADLVSDEAIALAKRFRVPIEKGYGTTFRTRGRLIPRPEANSPKPKSPEPPSL